MKKLLIVLFILLIGCDISYDESEVSDPKKVTTVDIQNTVIDSCAILATDGKYVYVMGDNLVKYKLAPIKSDYLVVHESYIFLTVFCLFILVVIITSKLLE